MNTFGQNRKRVSARNYHDVRRGYWHGKWYDSAWELALIVYCEDHHIELTRNTRKFEYHYGRSKKPMWYQPDFIDVEGHYIEVKGIIDTKTRRKAEWFPYPLRIFGYKEMKPYLEYMENTYGKDWKDKFHDKQ